MYHDNIIVTMAISQKIEAISMCNPTQIVTKANIFMG